jgi:hypothetical protein
MTILGAQRLIFDELGPTLTRNGYDTAAPIMLRQAQRAEVRVRVSSSGVKTTHFRMAPVMVARRSGDRCHSVGADRPVDAPPREQSVLLEKAKD